MSDNLATNDQLSDTLLVFDKEKMKIQAVKKLEKNGQMETITPTKKNQNQFLRIDRNGDFVSNFFTNFLEQLKNPTNFLFFKVPTPTAINKAKEIQNHLNSPTPEGKKQLNEFEIKPESHQIKNSKNMNTEKNEPEKTDYRFNSEQIDWETMSNLGLSRERLEKLNLLDPLLKGYKTNQLVPVSINFGSAILRTDVRLSLQQNEKGKVVPALHGIRKEPNLKQAFFGHQFTDEDKKNLLKTGNMGRVVDLINTKTGENIPSIISVDRLTNELIALKSELLKIADQIKGVQLNEDKKQILQEGKPLFLEGMTSTKGTEFSATVQFNADKRYVEFLFDKTKQNKQQQPTAQSELKEVPRIFRGKELDEDQYTQFKNGESVYLDGIIDKKGQTYQGYISHNKETGKTTFSFPNQTTVKAEKQSKVVDKSPKESLKKEENAAKGIKNSTKTKSRKV